MSTFHELKKKMGYATPFKEVYSTINYVFPFWEIMVATDNKSELEDFLRGFNWTLQDFVKEVKSANTANV